MKHASSEDVDDNLSCSGGLTTCFTRGAKMGLDTSHGAWNGPYSQFMRWRVWVAQQEGIPLGLMEGFFKWKFSDEDYDLANKLGLKYDDDGCSVRDLIRGAINCTPITWQKHPLTTLLSHSDCDGKIRWWECKDIALALLNTYRKTKGKDLIGQAPDVKRGCYDSMRAATLRFAVGAMKAWKTREDLRFH